MTHTISTREGGDPGGASEQRAAGLGLPRAFLHVFSSKSFMQERDTVPEHPALEQSRATRSKPRSPFPHDQVMPLGIQMGCASSKTQ